MSTAENIIEHAPYDAIFAMSVLCRWPVTRELKDISEIYPFNKFESIVEFLDTALSMNGLLIIANANFDFLDTKVAERYSVVEVNIESSGFVYQFDKNNQFRTAHPSARCIFQKMASTQIQSNVNNLVIS
ncbi:MAG: hypothetical protein WCD70_09865 [Alphaproteobacteria bacterium]